MADRQPRETVETCDIPDGKDLELGVVEADGMVSIHTILHPTDFSECSGKAFQLACALARDHGARLIVLHVAEPPMTAYGGVMTPPPPPRDYREAAEAQLHQVQAPEAGFRVEHLLTEGNPATEILRVAQEADCDLVVLGTHGRTGLGRLLMGSVAEQVVRKAACPVLTVASRFVQPPPAAPDLGAQGAAGAAFATQTILHPTDFSEPSRNGFRLACSLARDQGARLIVLHVVPIGTTEFVALTQLGTQEKTGIIRDAFWSDLRRIQPHDAAVRVEHRLEDGDPATEILRVAQETNCGLIVIGTHGRTWLGRLLMGNVAEQVVRRAPCPVLTVKTPLPDPASGAAREGVAQA